MAKRIEISLTERQLLAIMDVTDTVSGMMGTGTDFDDIGKEVKLIDFKRNRGYGAALKTGIINSSSEYICITDADGTYPINEIPKLAHFIEEGYSMVVGSRT